MRYSTLVLSLTLLLLPSKFKGQNLKTNKAEDAIWDNLSRGNVIKTNLNADAYQYPVIGNHGLVLLADPYGFTQNKPTHAAYSPDIYYSGWWKSNHYERANPFTIKGGYDVSGTLTPGTINSFSQTLDVTKGDLTTNLGLTVKALPVNSIRTQFVTADGVLVIKLEDDVANTFQVQISPQLGYILKHTAVSKGITASTATLGQGYGAVLSVLGSGHNVVIDTVNGIVSVEVSPGQPAYFYIAAGSEIIDGADYLSKTFQKASLASVNGYHSLSNASDSSYRAFWARSSVTVPNDDMMRKYILSQYILKALQGNNPLPDGCFGPRKEGYDGCIATECDLMFCWSAMLTANHANISRVLPDWYENTIENAKALAKTFYPKTNGVKWAWLSGYDGSETKNFNGKKEDWMAYTSAFAAHISLLQAQYTRDADRLARAKYILEHAVQYQLDACVKENGLWVNNGLSQGQPKQLRGEITEQSSLLWSLKKAKELRVGPSSWADEAKKIFIPMRYDSVQGKNILVRYIEHTPSLGSLPDGYFLYLYGIPWVTLFLRAFDAHDPLLQPTYQAYIGDKNLTYTFSKGIAAANVAMMGYGQEALSMLTAMPLHNDLYYSEYEDQPKTTIEVGAHGSLMLGVQHMLFDGQSENIIKIFPALPKEWENSDARVGFSNLLANGGIEVSGTYSNNRVNVTLNNPSDENVIRTLLVRIPSTFTKVSEKSGTKVEGIVNDRFAKMTIRISSHSVKTLTITGIQGNAWFTVDDSVAQFSRGWTSVSNAKFYGSTSHLSNIGGSSCEYIFTGNAVRILGQLGPDRGYAKVTIDGVNHGCYNLYAAYSQTQKVLFEKYNLSHGKHSIKWEVTGKKIQVSKNAFVDIDKIEVLNSRSKDSESSLTK